MGKKIWVRGESDIGQMINNKLVYLVIVTVADTPSTYCLLGTVLYFIYHRNLVS